MARPGFGGAGGGGLIQTWAGRTCVAGAMDEAFGMGRIGGFAYARSVSQAPRRTPVDVAGRNSGWALVLYVIVT